MSRARAAIGPMRRSLFAHAVSTNDCLRGFAMTCMLTVLIGAAATAQHGATAPDETATLDGDLSDAATDTVVTHRSRSDGEDVVIETYSPSVVWGHLVLSRRIRRVTTVTSDGSQTVEDIEKVNSGVSGAPLRVVRRTVTTVRRTGADAYEIERQVFEVDLNGRLVLRRTDRSSSR